jgi:hypothetical protein
MQSIRDSKIKNLMEYMLKRKKGSSKQLVPVLGIPLLKRGALTPPSPNQTIKVLPRGITDQSVIQSRSRSLPLT